MKQCPHLSKKLEEIPNPNPEDFVYKMNDKTYARYNEEIKGFFFNPTDPGIILPSQDLHKVKRVSSNARGSFISRDVINGDKDKACQI